MEDGSEQSMEVEERDSDEQERRRAQASNFRLTDPFIAHGVNIRLEEEEVKAPPVRRAGLARGKCTLEPGGLRGGGCAAMLESSLTLSVISTLSFLFPNASMAM